MIFLKSDFFNSFWSNRGQLLGMDYSLVDGSSLEHQLLDNYWPHNKEFMLNRELIGWIK